MKKLTIFLCLLWGTLCVNAAVTIRVADYAATNFVTHDEVFSIVADQADGNNVPIYSTSSKELRVYANGTLTIEAAVEMTEIVFAVTNKGLLGENAADCGTLTTDIEAGTVTWTGKSQKVVITIASKNTIGGDGTSNAQLRFSSLDVEVDADGPFNTLNVSVAEGCENLGKVAGNGIYPKFSDVTIIATPYDRCYFVQWSDGNTENPRTLALTTNVTLEAEFAQYPQNIEVGTCGAGLTWFYNTDTKVLSVTGTGDIEFWGEDDPWSDFRSSIEEISISQGVTGIGDYAFSYCTSLTSITIPDSVKSVGNNAFDGCKNLATVVLPQKFNTDIKIDSNAVYFVNTNQWTDIYVHAWGGTKVGTTWPGVKAKKANFTYQGYDIYYFMAPSGDYANCIFNDGGSGSEHQTDNLIWNGGKAYLTDHWVLFDNSYILTLSAYIGSEMFRNCYTLTSVTIPEGVTSIGERTFYNCSALTSVTIPEGVTSIGERTFYNCSALTSVTIPEGVTSIGDRAFYGCDHLASITIPASVMSIGEYALSFTCRTISFNSLTPPTLGEQDLILSGKQVFVPCEALEAYMQAWGDVHNIQIQGVSYKVILNSTEGGKVEQIGYVDCATNTAVIEAKVTADAHKFLKWSDGNTDNPRTLVLTQDTTLTAEFVECPYHTVIIGGVDIYGTYYRFEESYDPVGFYETSFSGGDTLSVCEGQKVTFKERHECGAWLGWSDGVADRERTIVVTSDTVISSRSDAKTYRVSITAGEGGCLNLDVNNYEGDFVGIRTECQSSIWLRAYANNGYYFTGWSDGVMEAGRDFHIFQDTTVVALFAQKVPAQVTTGVAENSIGMGSVSEGGVYQTGEQVSVSATPNEGYHFVEWSDGNAQAERTIYLTRDTTLYATFAVGTYGGKCGPNLYWTWDKTTQALLITGTGAMDTEHYAHWQSMRVDTVSLISLPDGITTISARAFSGWDSHVIYQVKNISIPASVVYIGWGAFDGCRTAERVEYLGNTAFVENVEGSVIYSDALSYAKVPANFISSRAKAIDSLIITNGEIKELYDYTASYMNLSAASNTDTEFFKHDIYTDPDILRTLILPAGLESIGADALRGCRYLQQITIPAGVKEIGTSAFEDCRSLSAVTFAGKNLEAIGDWAFYNCHNLRQIALPEGLQEIGTAAFYGCTFLSDLTIPSTTQKIAENAFALCAKMAKMYVNALVPPAIEEKTFEDVDRSIPVFVPKGTLERYQGDRYWSEFFNITEYDAPTGILNASAQGEDNARKVLRNGQVLIIRGDQTYTVLGDKL